MIETLTLNDLIQNGILVVIAGIFLMIVLQGWQLWKADLKTTNEEIIKALRAISDNFIAQTVIINGLCQDVKEVKARLEELHNKNGE